MARPRSDRPLLFCILIAAVFLTMISIDRIAPAVLERDVYFYHPWEYMMGAFRYNIPRTSQTMEMEGYGDLANMLGVPGYRVMRDFAWTNDRYGKRNATSTQHDAPAIVIVGDSFMASAADSDEASFVTQFQKKILGPVTGYAPSDMSIFLQDQRFKVYPPDIVLWGRVERNTLGSNGEIETLLKDTSCFSEVTRYERMEKTSKDFVKSMIGSFVEYAQLSILRRTMQQSLKHAIFAVTGEHVRSVILIPGEPMLFHDRGTALLSAPASARGFDRVVDAVAHVRDCLAKRGTQLIFMPIPDKEHVYATRLGREMQSPDPLGVLDAMLAEKNIARVSLINRFLEESTPGKDLLYWPDDTHWNARGIGVAVNVVVQMLGQ